MLVSIPKSENLMITKGFDFYTEKEIFNKAKSLMESGQVIKGLDYWEKFKNEENKCQKKKY